MTNENIFEQASRNRIRFDSPKGYLSVEDLWALPLTSSTGKANLDDLARGLRRALRETDGDVSFVEPQTPIDAGLQLQFDIVKRVIDVRLEERKAQEEATQRAAKKQQIMGLIVQKENEALAGQSVDDLRKLLAEL